LPHFDLIKKIEELSNKTNFENDRREYFIRDLSQDANSKIEISLMLNPRFEVDTETGMVLGSVFDNQKLGLIVEAGGRRATYLPGVFENIQWNELKKSLIRKSGGEGSAKFYAYKTQIINVPIYDTLFSETSLHLLEFDTAEFYSIKYRDFVPYEFTNGKIIIDKTQDVRNLGTIGDVIRFSKKYDFSSKMNFIRENLEYYYQKYLENPEELRQASVFMLEDYWMLGIHPDRTKKMEEYLYDNLDEMEPRFELGEALMVLAEISDRRDVFEKQAKKMYGRLEKMDGNLDEVFELNWQSQFLEKAKIYKKKNAEKIWEIISKIIQENPGKLETNYWAVIYECLSNLTKMLDGMEIKNRRLEYFIKLNSRRGEWGLYFFRGMQVARMDITGHIMFN